MRPTVTNVSDRYVESCEQESSDPNADYYLDLFERTNNKYYYYTLKIYHNLIKHNVRAAFLYLDKTVRRFYTEMP